nr:STAS domain-containing protein [Streptomyces sp. CBMA123]
MAIRLTRHGTGRCRAVVRGEIDADVAPALARALAMALRASTTGVDVVMTQVSFCDCRGLNALLTARSAAGTTGKDVVLASASPQVRRLLDLTDTTDLLATPGRAHH